MRTLIIHDGAVGDVLLSLPCIGAIAACSAELDIACRDDVGRLLKASGIVQGSFSSDSGMLSPWHAGAPDHAARELMGRYSRAIVFSRLDRSGLAANIAGSVRDTRIVATVPPEGGRTHVAAYRMGQLPAGMRSDVHARLSIPAAIRQRANEILDRSGWKNRDLIVLHPGSGGKHKCWPLERYLLLAEGLAAAAGLFILFLSGPAEERLFKERIGRFVRGRTGMAHVADEELAVVAGLLAESRLYVGNDSGISHLAAAAGAPVIALFGPTDPELWRPCGEAVRVVAAGTMEEITVDAVLAAAKPTGVQAIPA